MPAISALSRSAAAAAIVLVLGAAFASIPRIGRGDEQDAGADRIAALETQVADLDRRVSDLERADSTPEPLPTEGAEAPSPVGTPGDPVPLRQESEVALGWTMRVVAVIVDGADDLMTPNVFTDPLVEGYQLVVVAVALTNHSGELRRASSVIGISAQGRSGLSYRAFEGPCGAVQDELPSLEVPPGATIEGNLCFTVRTEDVVSLILYTETTLTSDAEDRVYFALS